MLSCAIAIDIGKFINGKPASQQTKGFSRYHVQTVALKRLKIRHTLLSLTAYLSARTATI